MEDLLLQRLLHGLQGRGGGEPGARGGDRDRRRGCYVPQHIVLLLSVYDGQILENESLQNNVSIYF